MVNNKGTSQHAVTSPTLCAQCRGSGTKMGVFHELDCMTCEGVGWVPGEGQDLLRQLGRDLTRQSRRVNILQTYVDSLPKDRGPERDYQDSPRDGVRGHFTGD